MCLAGVALMPEITNGQALIDSFLKMMPPKAAPAPVVSKATPAPASSPVVQLLLQKAQDESLMVIEDFSIESGKTKDLATILKNFTDGTRTVMILKDDDALLKRAGRNIPWLTTLSFNRLRAHDLFYGRKLIVLESAVKNLNEFYAAKAAKA